MYQLNKSKVYFLNYIISAQKVKIEVEKIQIIINLPKSK